MDRRTRRLFVIHAASTNTPQHQCWPSRTILLGSMENRGLDIRIGPSTTASGKRTPLSSRGSHPLYLIPFGNTIRILRTIHTVRRQKCQEENLSIGEGTSESRQGWAIDSRMAAALSTSSRSAAHCLHQLHADAAGAEHFVHAGEPQFAVPTQAHFLANSGQFPAIIGAAAPHPARPGARKRVLGRQQQHPRAGHASPGSARPVPGGRRAGAPARSRR